MSLPFTTDGDDADATVSALEFLARAQALLREAPRYFTQVRTNQAPRRLAWEFYHDSAPEVIRHARLLALTPELAGLREPLAKLATDMERLRIEAQKLL